MNMRMRLVTMYVPPRSQRCGSCGPTHTKRPIASASVAALWFELLSGQRAQRPQSCRSTRCQAKTILTVTREYVWTESERDRESRGGESDRLPGVCGRRIRGARDRPGRLTGRHRDGRVGPRAQQLTQVGDAGNGQVEGAEHETILRGGDDARLMGAVEGDRALHGRLLRLLSLMSKPVAAAPADGKSQRAAAGCDK
jgi:hypothetical protein